MSAENTPKPRMRTWLRVVLVASLALNLVIIGGATGMALRFGHSGPPPMLSDGPGSPMIRALSHEHRREMGRSIRKAHKGQNERGRDKSGYYSTLVTLLEAEPLDLDALRDASVTVDSRFEIRREVARDIWLEQVSTMTAEDRKAYAARMRDILSHKKPRKSSIDKDDH